LPRFLDRARTAVADAYLTPGLKAYVEAVSRAVAGAPLYFMTSGGGLMRAEAFRGRDAVLSGPAGGVIGVARIASAAERPQVLGLDMGGTSTDVCRFAGALERRDRISLAGVGLRAPMLDVETIAAGGGSVLAFDGLRARVGPQSAGAIPGPAAYGRGGPATITDANLVLGRLDPDALAPIFGPNGDQSLDAGAARARLSELAAAMSLPSPEAAAEGFLAVAVEQMAGAIRRVSTERGFDPRAHSLVAFGGAAGQLACKVAEALDIDEVLSPPQASLLSAWGIGQARMRVSRQAGLECRLDTKGAVRARALARRLGEDAAEALRAQGVKSASLETRLYLRYEEADTMLPASEGPLDAVKASFEAAHRRLFGFIETTRPILIASVEAEACESAVDGPVPARNESTTKPIDGPARIVRPDTQIWVDAGWRAIEDPDGLVRLTRVARAGLRPIGLDRPDPMTLELFNRRFMGVAEAMGAALERTARSVNIKERLDFSCALFDAAGDLVANAPHMPVHLGSMGASVRAVQARHSRLHPGEAFALNNPYAGGTHLPDITVVMPVFTRAEDGPAFFVAARGHHADVGGTQPGSMPPFSRTLSEEGVLFDALPIMRDGELLETDIRAALAAGPWPARAPERNLGDLKAQIAACQAGAAAVTALIDLHGGDVVARYMGFVQANAEACVRRAIRRLRDGAARVRMDGDAEIVVRTRVDHERGEAVLDFRDSSGQLDSNFNAPTSIVHAAALYVFRALVDDEIPLNAGCLKPLQVLVTEGSMLAPGPPAAVVAGNVETSQHLVDTLFEALGVMAHAQGTMNNFTFGDERRQYYETICGGVGATSAASGASAVHSHMTNSRLTDPEILERRFPVRIERFVVRRGSGGCGVHRGGDGVVRTVRFLAPLDVALLSTRREHSPAGLAGGGSGAPGRQRLIDPRGRVKELSGRFSIKVRPGDVIEIETPGGGGFGRPDTPHVS